MGEDTERQARLFEAEAAEPPATDVRVGAHLNDASVADSGSEDSGVALSDDDSDGGVSIWSPAKVQRLKEGLRNGLPRSETALKGGGDVTGKPTRTFTEGT